MKNFWTNLATLFMIAIPCWYYGGVTMRALSNGGLGQMNPQRWINLTFNGILLVYGILRLFGFKFPWSVKIATTEEPRRPTQDMSDFFTIFLITIGSWCIGYLTFAACFGQTMGVRELGFAIFAIFALPHGIRLFVRLSVKSKGSKDPTSH